MHTTVTARRSIPWIVVALSLFAAEVPAGSFQVNPIRVEMTKGATTAAITVRNDGEDAIVPGKLQPVPGAELGG